MQEPQLRTSTVTPATAIEEAVRRQVDRRSRRAVLPGSGLDRLDLRAAPHPRVRDSKTRRRECRCCGRRFATLGVPVS
jgi:hypothetical protein